MKKTNMMIALALFFIALMSSPAMAFRLSPDARIRAVHLSPDAPNVDVWADGNVVFSNVAFGEFSDYATVPFGTYNIQVVPAGATEPVVIDADLRLQPVKDYTVLAVNTLDSIEPIVIADRRFAVHPRQASVRFVHASPDAPAVDIALDDGPVVFADVEFKEVEDYLRLPAGEYDLEVRLAGTDTVALDLPPLTFESGTAYTAVAQGLVSDGSLNALLLEDRESPGRARW
jgi:hypothetical protein